MEINISITRGHTIALFKIISLGLIFGLGIQLIFAWTAPTATPPAGNVTGPITTGPVSQYKAGALGVEGLIHGFSTAIFDGNVGVGTGTTLPAAKLDVVGTVKATGLQLPTGAGAGKVLTSDAGGNASWADGAGGSGPTEFAAAYVHNLYSQNSNQLTMLYGQNVFSITGPHSIPSAGIATNQLIQCNQPGWKVISCGGNTDSFIYSDGTNIGCSLNPITSVEYSTTYTNIVCAK